MSDTNPPASSQDSYVELPSTSGGPNVEAFQITTPWNLTVYRQVVSLGDGGDYGQVAQVDTVGRLATRPTDDGGLLDTGADLIVPGATQASGDEPALTVQVNQPILLDPSGLNPIAGTDRGGIVRPLRVGADGGTQFSDCVVPPGAPFLVTALGQRFVIDTQGFSSVVIQVVLPTGAWSGTCSLYAANDLSYILNTTNVVFNETNANAYATTVTAAGIFTVAPLTGRYLIINCGAYISGQLLLSPVLRVFGAPRSLNLTQIVGNTVTTAGQNGTLVIGGGSAAGSVQITNPVNISGVDQSSSAFTRRIISDANGYLIATGSLPNGSMVGQYNPALSHITTTLSSITQALSQPNPVVVGGTDNQNRITTLNTDPVGNVFTRYANHGARSSAETLDVILATLKALLKVTLAAQSGPVTDDAEMLVADELAADYFQQI